MYFPALVILSLLTNPGAIAAPGSRANHQVDFHGEDCPGAPQTAPDEPSRLPRRITHEVARKILDSRRGAGNVNQGIIFDAGPGNATAVSNTTAASNTPIAVFPTPSSPSPPDQTAPMFNMTTLLPPIPVIASSSLLTIPSPMSGASPITASSRNFNRTITITGPTLTLSTITLPTPTSTRTVFVTAAPITISPTGVINGTSNSPSLSILTIITVTAWPHAPPAPPVAGTVEPLVGDTVTITQTTTYATTFNGIAGKGTATWTSVVVIPNSVTDIEHEGSSAPWVTTPMTAPLATVTGIGAGTTFEIVLVTLPAPAPSVVTVYAGTTTVTV